MENRRRRPAGVDMRRGGIQRTLYRLTYDKPGVHKKALQISNSLEEVKKILGNVGRKKTDQGEYR